jgi:hypothetical protein
LIEKGIDGCLQLMLIEKYFEERLCDLNELRSIG